MNDLHVIGHNNVREMPARLFMSIRKELNHNSAWKRIASKLSGDYEMNDQDVLGIENEDDQAASFVLRLGTRGMTIGQFVHYAGLAQLLAVVNKFSNVNVPVTITCQPFQEMNVCEGELVELKVEASGVPPPAFQWHKHNHGPIASATSNCLVFASVTLLDSGTYFCVVSNSPEARNWICSDPVQLQVTRAKPMEIREHPNSFTVSQGGNALLKCDVLGDGPIMFQWMKDDQDLSDGAHYSGSQSHELRIYDIDSQEWTGCYSCRITRNQEVVYTNIAILQLSQEGPPRCFKATDKVALLLGAGDYMSDTPLTAPENDLRHLAKIFVSLNFKVVTLYNLTKLEMISAIDEFKELVGEGVYCVFYFCGHGFEASNHCFLVPPDAPQGYDHSNCLSADEILFNVLLPQKPEVCCMILDICRKNREGRTRPRHIHKDIQAGNYMVCYGTSQGLAAYEGRKQGILVSHLKNLLIQDMSIEGVFQKLREEISNDPKLKQKKLEDKKIRQIPEVRSNMSQTELSFRDPIDYKGHTTEFFERMHIWERAHVKPDERDLTVPFGDLNFSVKLRLTFQQEFSNVLKIYLSVVDPGPTFSCHAHISAIPLDVGAKAKVVQIRSGTKTSLCQNYITLYDIQRLRTDMKIEITVSCQMEYGGERREIIHENLGLPLVSRLRLWEERAIKVTPGELEPEESDEEAED